MSYERMCEMNIIFVRHGAAEKVDKEIQDFHRKLTPEGRITVKEVTSHIVAHLTEGTDIHIWSSPADRAVQTAEIIAAELKIEPILLYDFIWNGDYHAFANELQRIIVDMTLIIVGHEPYLGDWVSRLQENNIKFRKGTVAGLTLQAKEVLIGSLTWIVHPDRPKKNIDKDKTVKSNATTTLIYELFMCNLNGLRDDIKKFYQMPDEAESVHEFRVRIRSIRSLLSFLKPLCNEEDYTIAQESLKILAHYFSYIRQLDVLIGAWTSFAGENWHTNNNSMMFILQKEREKEKACLCAMCAVNFFDLEIERVVASLKFVSSIFSDHFNFDKFVSRRFHHWDKQLIKELNHIKSYSLTHIHPLRIKSKKLRYVKEHLAVYLEKDCKSKLKTIQTILGEICDIETNAELLGALTEKNDISSLHYDASIFFGYQVSQKKKLIKKLNKTI